MPLAIDTSSAVRSLHGHAHLTEAVARASDNDESDWIEWKNSLDLQKKETHASIARCIIGLANRIPEDARRHAEGCGYLVIGAAPGIWTGVIEVDPATLDQGIRAYLGSEGHAGALPTSCGKASAS